MSMKEWDEKATSCLQELMVRYLREKEQQIAIKTLEKGFLDYVEQGKKITLYFEKDQLSVTISRGTQDTILVLGTKVDKVIP